MAFEDAFSKAFNTSLASSQQQLPRLLKMQQEMQDKMDEKMRAEVSRNSAMGIIADVESQVSTSSSKTAEGMVEGHKIAEAYRQLAKLPDHMRQDKQVVARTFREAAGFDPSENVITNVTKGDPIQLQREADILTEEVVNNFATAADLRKLLKSSTASAAAIAASRERKPGRLNSENQTEAQLVIQREMKLMEALNAAESKLLGNPGYEDYMKPIFDARRQQSEDIVALQKTRFDMDISLDEARLARIKSDREGDIGFQRRRAEAIQAGEIAAGLKFGPELAEQAGRVKYAENYGSVSGDIAAKAEGLGSADPDVVRVTESELRKHVADSGINQVVLEATKDTLTELGQAEKQSNRNIAELQVLNAALDSGEFRPGAFGQARLLVSKFFDLVGLDPAKFGSWLGDPEIGELIDRSNIARTYTESLNVGGRMSNERMQLLRKAMIGIDTDPRAAKVMMEIALRRAEQDKRAYRAARSFVQRYGNDGLVDPDGNTVDDIVNKTRDEYPLVTEELENRIKNVTTTLDEYRTEIKMAEDSKITRADLLRAVRAGHITSDRGLEIARNLGIGPND